MKQHHHSPDLRIAVLGNVDSGKSTLVGVLSKYVLDDGRGLARMRVLQHQHEKDKGQTSTVALEVVGYDLHGVEVRPPPHIHHQHVKELHHVASRSSRLVSIIDLCGHEHFLKTTVFGLMGLVPDMVVLVVGGNAGVQKMTREHLGLAVALHLPVCVVVTKIDMAPAQVLDDSLKRVDRILRVAGRKKYSVRTPQDCLEAAQAMSTSQVVAPVFQLSCVSGQGLDLLRLFLQHLTCDAECEGLAGQSIRGSYRHDDDNDDDRDKEETNCEMQIDNTYNVPGVGTVVSGSVFHGQLVAGAKLLLGPDEAGEFKEAKVQSVHRQCVPVDRAFSGQQCTAAIKLVRGHHLFKPRKGLVLLSPQRMDLLRLEQDGVVAVRTFDCQVRILHHTTTIQPGYMPIIHLGTIRQSAVIEQITHDEGDGDGEEKQALRTGSVAVVRFRFAYRPEFVTVGRPLVFREGTTKGVGKVLRLVT